MVKNSVIADNGGVGVFLATSQNVTLQSNILYGNAGVYGHSPAQIQVAGLDVRPELNQESGEKLLLIDENMTIRDNIIVGTGKQFGMHVWRNHDRFKKTLISQRNLWFNSNKSDLWFINDATMTFSDWQILSRQDLGSLFADPRFVAPEKHDFRLRKDSPLNRKKSWPLRQKVPSLAAHAAFLRAQRLKEVAQNWNDSYPAAKAKATWKRLDLRALANRPLAGEESWIGIPLEFESGRKQIHGVPFEVIDQRTNAGLAAIALRSLKVPQTRGQALPAEIVVPFGGKAKAIYFLHGAGWIGAHGKIGEYRFRYEDGSHASVPLVAYGPGSEHVDVLRGLQRESNIQDWWPAVPQFENRNARKVIVASANDPAASPRYLYTLQWLNPHPAKLIKEIRLASQPDREASVIVLAITAMEAR